MEIIDNYWGNVRRVRATPDDVHELCQLPRAEERVGLYSTFSDWDSAALDVLRKAPPFYSFDCSEDMEALRPFLMMHDGGYDVGLGEIGQKEPVSPDLLARIDSLSFHWTKGMFDAVFEASHIKGLRIWGYPFEDLKPLHQMKNLRRLGLIQGKLQSTTGIEAFPGLWGLELALLPRLTGEAISLTPTLQILDIHSCRKLASIDFVASAPDLRYLEIESRITIPTVHALRGCKHLDHLSLSYVKVEDGDVRFLLEEFDLDCLWLYPIGKHYNIKKKDLRRGTPDRVLGSWQLRFESPYSN